VKVSTVNTITNLLSVWSGPGKQLGAGANCSNDGLNVNSISCREGLGHCATPRNKKAKKKKKKKKEQAVRLGVCTTYNTNNNIGRCVSYSSAEVAAGNSA
jgi:hypothetical protein